MRFAAVVASALFTGHACICDIGVRLVRVLNDDK
jgi:hypothetical protein